jgi:hypothetical protein
VEEILVGVGREPQFRKKGQNRALLGRGVGQADRFGRVESRVGNLDFRDADARPDESVAVKVEKILPGKLFHDHSFST